MVNVVPYLPQKIRSIALAQRTSPLKPRMKWGSSLDLLEGIQVSASTKDSLKLSWEVLPNAEDVVQGYQLRYRATGSSVIEYTDRLEQHLRSWEIGQLHENTDYEICFWTFFDPKAALNSIAFPSNTSKPLPTTPYQLLHQDPAELIEQNKVMLPYCWESSTGVDAAKVALVSTLGAFFAIGIVLFFVFLARWQEDTIKSDEGREKVEEEREEDGEKVSRRCRRRKKKMKKDEFCGKCNLKKKKGWWRRRNVEGEVGVSSMCDNSTEECVCRQARKSGLFSSFKSGKGFRIKNQLKSSKQVLGHAMVHQPENQCQHHGNNHDHNDHNNDHNDHSNEHNHIEQHHQCTHCTPQHSDTNNNPQIDNPSLHSSLLSLINEEPGNMFLVATTESNNDEEEDDGGGEGGDGLEGGQGLAYLIPIMKCPDGTLILGGGAEKLNGDVEEIEEEEEGYDEEEEEDGNEGDAEEEYDLGTCLQVDDILKSHQLTNKEGNEGNFDMLPVVFSPEFKLSVLDSVYVGDIEADDDDDEGEEEEEDDEGKDNINDTDINNEDDNEDDNEEEDENIPKSDEKVAEWNEMTKFSDCQASNEEASRSLTSYKATDTPDLNKTTRRTSSNVMSVTPI